MAFGSQQPAQGGSPAGAERWESRTITIVDGQEKSTKAGKVYWRVKDSNGKWYSVWNEATKVRLEMAASTQEAVPVAVQITPGNAGGNPFYTIAGTDAAVEGLVAEGAAKAIASVQPGGKNSEFGKRMHPDESLRIMLMNVKTSAVEMAIWTGDERPEKVTKEQWLYAKIPEYMTFLSGLVKMPLTPTPEAAPTPTPAPAPTGFGAPPMAPTPSDEPPIDDPDIPF
jgi:hypothetical protein